MADSGRRGDPHEGIVGHVGARYFWDREIMERWQAQRPGNGNAQ
jgi:hypothetical protein